MKKTLTAGTEIDGYCTKCKLDLNHRIVAMAEGKPARAECLTCHTQHNYYKPKTAAAAKTPKVKRVRDPKATPRTTAKTVLGLRLHWEKTIQGRNARDFTPYAIATAFSLGELVSHTKFGEGFVTEITDVRKVTVLFEGGSKLLAQATPS